MRMKCLYILHMFELISNWRILWSCFFDWLNFRLKTISWTFHYQTVGVKNIVSSWSGNMSNQRCAYSFCLCLSLCNHSTQPFLVTSSSECILINIFEPSQICIDAGKLRNKLFTWMHEMYNSYRLLLIA